jgi:hypothetical protein
MLGPVREDILHNTGTTEGLLTGTVAYIAYRTYDTDHNIIHHNIMK